MIGIGPFSVDVVIVAGCVLLGWWISRLLTQRRPDMPAKVVASLFLDAVLVGFATARLGYVIWWWREYVRVPWSIIAIGDGGFLWWVGAIAALFFVGWRTAAVRAIRVPVMAGLVGGLLAWAAAVGIRNLLENEAHPLPSVELAAIDGRPVALDSYVGRPVVINLWATWCPPCRREMPVFQRAEAEIPDVSFLMINQGEGEAAVASFLTAEGLHFREVLRDSGSKTMQVMGVGALPTTLFFDSHGRLIDSHMGEMTMPSIKRKIARLRSQSHLKSQLD